MKFEIKNTYSGTIIYQAEAETFKALVEAAIRAKINLRGADLRGADLREANLIWADLRGADLREANIAGIRIPNIFPIARLDFGGWSILVTPTHTTIGCQTHPNSDWLKWTPSDVAKFSEGAKEFWKQHGPVVKAAIRDVQSQTKKVKS